MAPDSIWGNVFKRDEKKESRSIKALKNIPIFSNLESKELKELDKIMHRRIYSPREQIFRESEPGVGMYIILNGKVKILKEVTESSSETLAVLESGEFFGDLALLDESPRSASAVASEECEILGFFRPDLMNLLERKPKLGIKIVLNLARVVGERLRHSNEELQRLKKELEKYTELNECKGEETPKRE